MGGPLLSFHVRSFLPLLLNVVILSFGGHSTSPPLDLLVHRDKPLVENTKVLHKKHCPYHRMHLAGFCH